MKQNNEIEIMRKKMGLVLKKFNMWKNLRVMEKIVKGKIKVKKRKREEEEEKEIDMLKSLGMREKENMFKEGIQGGKKKRVEIEREIEMGKEMMILDEKK